MQDRDGMIKVFKHLENKIECVKKIHEIRKRSTIIIKY